MKSVGLALVFGLIAAPGKIVNFDADPLGRAPSGWTVIAVNGSAAPEWEILRDQTAATQPYVLARVSPGATEVSPALALLDGVDLRDCDVSVRVKPVGGKRLRSGGLVFRYRDENNYYWARADALQQTVAVFKMERGQRIQLGNQVKHALPPDAWRILKVAARGNRLQVYLDHRRVLDVSDRSVSVPGKVGVWADGDSVTYFDDFRVYPK